MCKMDLYESVFFHLLDIAFPSCAEFILPEAFHVVNGCFNSFMIRIVIYEVLWKSIDNLF